MSERVLKNLGFCSSSPGTIDHAGSARRGKSQGARKPDAVAATLTIECACDDEASVGGDSKGFTLGCPRGKKRCDVRAVPELVLGSFILVHEIVAIARQERSQVGMLEIQTAVDDADLDLVEFEPAGSRKR